MILEGVVHYRSMLASAIPVNGAVALAVVGALLIGGCGSSNSGSGSAPPKLITKVDPCMLVTAADASAAVGKTVSKQDTGAQGSQTTTICLYASSDFQATVTAVATVYPDTTAANAVTPEKMAAGLGKLVTGTKSVAGIGDKAIEFNLGGEFAIMVFKTNVSILIVARPASNPSVVETLAKTAVGKL